MLTTVLVHDSLIKKTVLVAKVSTPSSGTDPNKPFPATLVPGKDVTKIAHPQKILNTSTNPSDKTSPKLATVSL